MSLYSCMHTYLSIGNSGYFHIESRSYIDTLYICPDPHVHILHKCCKCGSTDSLEFDHIDPAQKFTHRIFSLSHDRIQAELGKCQLLCKDCHVEKTNSDLYKPRVHGTVTMYRKEKCRCDLCKQAKRDSR